MRPAGRPKQVAALIEATSVVSFMLRNFVPGDVRGAWQRLAVRARVAVRRTIIGCDEYVAPSKSNSHLTWNRLSADCVGASSVNIFKNKIDIYLRRAGYT